MGKNEISNTITTVNYAQKFINIISVLKKITITATAAYVAVMVFKIYKNN